ncbi:MAG: ABC transporter ATP-binding protein [Pseudomonadota bacterium]|nr:ABC transporter ATP-binding protein [Pseudomonadota bacterium]
MSRVLDIKAVSKTYGTGNGELTVLSGADLILNKGERVAIVGQSGSGKSTLLHIAGLLDAPTAGEVMLNGVSVNAFSDRKRSAVRNSTFGFIYQTHHLMPDFTALENVMMPARIAGMSQKAALTRAHELLAKVGLAHRLEHRPSELSGGEGQRVAIARALMNKPEVLLADEPTGSLDPENADSVFELFESLVKEEGMALLMVTHNPELASRCDRVLNLDHGHLTESV